MIALWEVAVLAPPAREDEVAASLAEFLDAAAATYRDEDTGALRISAYLEELPQPPGALRRALAKLLQLPPRAIIAQRLRRENWATSWKRHFKPIQVGARLLVKPSWSRRRAHPGQRVVILDPGLSFGTGQHETTAFCLRQLVRCRDKSKAQSFLDIGTGSGILAIAAAKLGYAPVEAFDYDPAAVATTTANARKNRVDSRVRPRCVDLTAADGLPRRRFDVICANLTYDLLAAEAGKISRLLAPGGQLIVAGILSTQFSIVTESLHNFALTLVREELKNNWRSGQFASRAESSR